MLEDSGFDQVEIGPAVDTFVDTTGQGKARAFEDLAAAPTAAGLSVEQAGRRALKIRLETRDTTSTLLLLIRSSSSISPMIVATFEIPPLTS